MAASRVDRESSLGFADGEQQNALQDLSSDDLCLPSSSTSLLAAPASTPCTTYSMFQQCHVNQPDRLKTSSVHSLETIFYLIIPLPFIALAVMLLLAEGKEQHAATWTFSQYQDYTKIVRQNEATLVAPWLYESLTDILTGIHRFSDRIRSCRWPNGVASRTVAAGDRG